MLGLTKGALFCRLNFHLEINMDNSELGIMIISMIGLFGFASFVFEYLSAKYRDR
jgi:hypothetical protein